ncbi:MAG: surface lipoprotein assembly modifier [Pseudomonadota bacterium]|nr:surface lipoprotein assembly modifier [Pseudomonadota bacterium]
MTKHLRALHASALALIFTLAGCLPIAAFAGIASQPQLAAYATYDDKRRLRLLIDLVRSGQHDLADELLHTQPFTGPFAGNRALFVEGMILRAKGDRQAAVRNYRTALSRDPSLTLVRLELAQTLSELGEDDGAKHHLELLMSAAPSAEHARSLRSFVDAIDARRPWRANAYVSVAPSTNVYGGTTNDTYYWNGIPFEFQGQKSGVGLAGGLNGAYVKRFGPRLSGIAAGGIDARKYEDADFDTAVVSQSGEIRLENPHGYVGIGATAWEQLRGDGSENFSFGPRLSGLHRFTPALIARGSLSADQRDYENDNRDGFHVTAEGRLTGIIDPTLTVYGLGAFEYEKTELESTDYLAETLGLGVYREFSHALTFGGEVSLRHEGYAGDYSILGEPREDWRGNLTVNLTKRDFTVFGYAPVVEYTYTRNLSNVPFFEFDAHGLDLRLTKAF